MTREEYTSCGYADPECTDDELELLSVYAFRMLDALSGGGLAKIIADGSEGRKLTAQIAVAAQIFSMLQTDDDTICNRSMYLMGTLGIFPAERSA